MPAISPMLRTGLLQRHAPGQAIQFLYPANSDPELACMAAFAGMTRPTQTGEKE